MLPKIQISTNKETFTREEVEQMVEEIQETFEGLMIQQIKQHNFAKRISYLSLIIAALLIGKELFL